MPFSALARCALGVAALAASGARPAALAADMHHGPRTGALQAIGVSPHAEPVPAEVAAALQPLIAAGGARAKISESTLDFWWVKGLEAAAPASPPSWSDVEEGSLVGIVRIAGLARDIRGRTVKAGTYTLRYGLQPQNGDHLGVSRHRDYLLLSPAAVDVAVAPAGHDGAVDLSKQTIGSAHPAPWSIDPPDAKEAALSLVSHPDDQLEGVVFEVPVVHRGKPVGALRFGLVLLGRIEG